MCFTSHTDDDDDEDDFPIGGKIGSTRNGTTAEPPQTDSLKPEPPAEITPSKPKVSSNLSAALEVKKKRFSFPLGSMSSQGPSLFGDDDDEDNELDWLKK